MFILPHNIILRIMKKEKIHIEYLLNASSRNILWAAISTPSGLENWFADEVIKIQEKVFSFKWGKTETRDAEIINLRVNSFVRFHWVDDEEDLKSYFEFKMSFNELTSDYVLEVTDFAEPDEINDQIGLWNSQIETLKRVGGM